MEQNNNRFALIFQKVREKYEIDVAALLDYDETTNNYKVIAGKYKDDDRGDFSLLVGDSDFIYGKGIELYMKEGMGPYAPFIYIFDPKDIESLAEKQGLTIEQTYHYIINKVNCIKLMDVGGHEYKSMFSMKSRIVPFTAEQIANMLYNDIDDKKIDNFKISFPEVSPLGENNNSKDKNQNEDELTDEEFEEKLAKAVETVSKDLGISLKIGFIGPNGIEFANKESDKGETLTVDSILREVKERQEKKEKRKQVDVVKIIDEINKKIVGQEEAIKTLVANICFNQKLIDSLTKPDGTIDLGELDARKISILLDGSTGTGKTAIIKEIASKLSLPFKKVNANSFSETGYVGPTITDILSDLLEQAEGDIELAERGIVVFDEIDKIASNASYSGKDMKQGVQEELLGFISGGEYEISQGNGFYKLGEMFDTSKLTFILSGAFTSMKEKKKKENTTQTIGFSNGKEEEKTEYEVTPQDYIDYGLMREFFGRIKVLSSTNTYTKEDLRKILLESSISPLKNFEKTVQMYGYKGITYDDEFLDNICEEAYNMDTGARALQTIMSGIQNRMIMGLTIGEYDRNEPISISTKSIEEYKQGNKRSY